MEFTVSSVSEARDVLRQIRNHQKKLRQIKRDINATMKAIRAEYRQQSSNAASGASTVLTVMGDRKAAGKVRADAKRQLRRERDIKLQPYDETKLVIDDLLLQMDSAKAKIQKFIEDTKAEKEAEEADRKAKIKSLRTFHLDTPSPNTWPVFTTEQFNTPMPYKPPNNINYTERKPSPPTLKKKNLWAKLFSGYRQRVEEENQELTRKYEEQLAKWQEGKRQAEAELETKKQEYQRRVEQWEKAKLEFEEAEQIRVARLREQLKSAVNFMQAFLAENLDAIEWPTKVSVSFQVREDGKEISLEVELPRIEEWPVEEKTKTQERRDYLVHIHSIGFRLIGEVFHLLPSASKIILSGYVMIPNKRTGQLQKSYLYSVKVLRQDWSELNFDKLDWINVVDCFEEFDIQRRVTARAIIRPIEPLQ